MIFHDNRLPADDSHEISYLIFAEKKRYISQNWESAAVVIGALRVKTPALKAKFYAIGVAPRSSGVL